MDEVTFDGSEQNLIKSTVKNILGEDVKEEVMVFTKRFRIKKKVKQYH